MNSNEFVSWLQGFLDGSASCSSQFVREQISKKIKEVKLVGPHYYPQNWPYWWTVNGSPAVKPVDLTPKITCEPSQTTWPNYTTAVNLPHVSVGSNTQATVTNAVAL